MSLYTDKEWWHHRKLMSLLADSCYRFLNRKLCCQTDIQLLHAFFFGSITFGLPFHRCALLEHGVIYHFSSFLANCMIPYSSSSFHFYNNWGLSSLMTKSYLTKLKTAKQALQVISFFELLLEDFYQDSQFFESNQFLCQMLHNLWTVDDFPLH